MPIQHGPKNSQKLPMASADSAAAPIQQHRKKPSTPVITSTPTISTNGTMSPQTAPHEAAASAPSQMPHLPSSAKQMTLNFPTLKNSRRQRSAEPAASNPG